MKENRDIEEPVKKSWKVLLFGFLSLALMLGLGIYLFVEALQKPKTPEDVLDMKRMLVSGIGVILFSLAVVVFLFSLYKPRSKKRFGLKRKALTKKRNRYKK
jgi:Co/Zn/Cd efflux system component